jgi:hypothetical protein
VLVTGSIASSTIAPTLAGNGGLGVAGTVSASFAKPGMVAAGTRTQPLVTGSIAGSTILPTLAASGSHGVGAFFGRHRFASNGRQRSPFHIRYSRSRNVRLQLGGIRQPYHPTVWHRLGHRSEAGNV